MDDLKILEILCKAKELGITKEDVEAYKSKAPVTQLQDEKELAKILIDQDMPTDEEVLYYATPFYDELQARKEAQTKHIKDEVN